MGKIIIKLTHKMKKINVNLKATKILILMIMIKKSKSNHFVQCYFDFLKKFKMIQLFIEKY